MSPSPEMGERRLCAILGHELRNPLASAMASMSVVEEMTSKEDLRQSFMLRARADLERLSSLLSSYLGYGTAAESCQRRPLDLRDLLRGLQRRHTALALSVDLPSQEVQINGDKGLLGRAIDNLIENAFAVGAKGVSVTLRTEMGRAVLWVRDDGPGVPESLWTTLFEPFVSGRGSSGLGLALSREVLVAHGGAITLNRSAHGACFKIVLPLQMLSLATA